MSCVSRGGSLQPAQVPDSQGARTALNSGEDESAWMPGPRGRFVTENVATVDAENVLVCRIQGLCRVVTLSRLR